MFDFYRFLCSNTFFLD